MTGRCCRVGLVCCAVLLLGAAAAGCQHGSAPIASVAPAAASAKAATLPASSAAATGAAEAAPAMPGKNVPAIKVDTVGYPPAWRKLAIFNVAPVGAVVKDEAGKVVYTFK